MDVQKWTLDNGMKCITIDVPFFSIELFFTNPPIRIFLFNEIFVLLNMNIDKAKRLISQGKDLNRNIKYIQNNIRHQYENSECGIYCIHFTVRLL